MKIGHIADLQVKNRGNNLYRGYAKSLKQIETTVASEKIDILVIPGDFFEYDIPNDSERKLIYNFLSRLLGIDSLKEIVFIAGNHDLIKDKKQSETSIGYNPLNVFSDMISNIDKTKSAKLIYGNQSIVYNSKITNKHKYFVYSLEDNMQTKFEVSENDNSLKICLFHAMLKEFVDEYKIPLRKDIKNNLISIDQFPANSLIIAGDIHKNLKYVGLANQNFYYSGSQCQHTHSEGVYIDLSEKGFVVTPEEQKVLKVYEYSDSLETVGLSDINVYDIPLTNQIGYITLTLDYKLTNEDILKMFEFDHLSNKKFGLHFGAEQTFIKIKTTNKFIDIEMKIFNALMDYSNKTNLQRINIEFDYEKLVQSNLSVNSSVVQKIIDEKNEELNLDVKNPNITIDSNNIDSLILSDKHIIKLFESVLENLVKSIKSDDVEPSELISEILALFSSEIANVQSTSKRYKIILEDIETNGFMNLGPNRVQLNIPGLSRILGTNGVGKTTLFRMIRWCITGEVFENMSKTSVMRNNLVVFNKHDHTADFVAVQMRMNVNNQTVFVKRSAERKWKNNVTDEQKMSLNWKDYVSTVDRRFEFTIIDGSTPSDETKSKTYAGETAEKAILLWFGQSLNNILFINYPKLENLLRTSSDILNEMILNFIGVDYIKSLQNNLDNVKNNLNTIAKPKLSKDDLALKITDCKIFIKNSETEIETKTTESETIKTSIEKISSNLKVANNELINIGNISQQIEDKKINIASLEKFLKEFIPKVKKIKLDFTETKPVFDSEKELQLNTEKSILTERLDLIKTDVSAHVEKFKPLTESVDVYIEEITNKYNRVIENNNLMIKGCNENIKFNYLSCLNFIDERLALFNEKYTTKLNDVSTLLNTYNQNSDKITSNNTQLESGICPSCKRPLSDNPEEFEKHRQEVLAENEKLQKDNNLLFPKIVEERTLAENIKAVITKYNTLRDYALKLDKQLLETDLKNVQTGCEQYFKNINNKLLEINNFENNIKKLSNLITKFNLIGKIKNGDYTIETSEVFKEFGEDIQNSVIDLINKSKNWHKIDNELNDKFDSNKTELTNVQTELNNLTTLYNTALTEYQTKLENHIKSNSEIDKYNEEVEIHNKSQFQKEIELNNERIYLTELETKKLPLYNETKIKYDGIEKDLKLEKEKFEKITKELNEEKITYERNKFNLDAAQKEYLDYLQYAKNQLILKIYSKLIKENFKDIVFDYYRTFLNNTLNVLLGDVNFKLFWNEYSELYMVQYKNGVCSYQPVQQSSGMETTFLGLALVYTMHLLNVKNSISHIFIDELSGTLNNGEDLSYDADNYQELMVLILSKFVDKNIFIVDHSIKNLYETAVYEVMPNGLSSKIMQRI